ncbi:hypothetical protein E2986_12825 [Frieseomelitta varia]|uniref:Uncharacterized protein n=1 Tax=Frieseomelitta varia TaxID=561572 RepID=A0A833W9H9_9HYME|nr:hypothetical protein E2986_12825 [Frieseomelitta varia]
MLSARYLLTERANKPSTDSPTMAHTALREIVERAVEEARKLPGLGGSGDTGKAPEARNVAEHSYEDVLATAILNKQASSAIKGLTNCAGKVIADHNE